MYSLSLTDDIKSSWSIQEIIVYLNVNLKKKNIIFVNKSICNIIFLNEGIKICNFFFLPSIQNKW